MSTPLRMTQGRLCKRAERRVEDLALAARCFILSDDQFSELRDLEEAPRSTVRQARDKRTLPWVPAIEAALAKAADARVAMRRKLRADVLEWRKFHPSQRAFVRESQRAFVRESAA